MDVEAIILSEKKPVSKDWVPYDSIYILEGDKTKVTGNSGGSGAGAGKVMKEGGGSVWTMRWFCVLRVIVTHLYIVSAFVELYTQKR